MIALDAPPPCPGRDPSLRLAPTGRRILEAARRLLARNGYAGLTIDAIAKEAGESKSSVHYHFGGKAGLMTALADWNKRILQPTALKTFRSPVSTIVGASSYACRNVYGLPTGNLSQHAFGNAIDIGAFELANDRVVTVLQGWGPTERDIEERKKQERLKLRTAISAKSTNLPGTGRIEISKLKAREAGLKPLPMDRPVTGSDQPSPPAAKPSPPASEMTFLRSLRSGACGPFATVLGPEANEVHRNHLHFDLNPARYNAHCD